MISQGLDDWLYLMSGMEWGNQDIRSAVPKAGGRLNKKDGLTRYGDSHVKDKTS